MAKKSFKCRDCGEKIVVKEAGSCRCDNCGAIYKCYFELKKEEKKTVHPVQIEGGKKESILTFYKDNRTA
ncbi:MAG: hypothetical protein AB7E96_11240 [Deferribacterales bacterium]